MVREFSVMAALRGCDFFDLRGGKRPFRNLVTPSQDDGRRQELAVRPHCAWLRVDRAKRIVPPLRGFPVSQYRVPTAVAVGYAVPPLAGLDKEKEKNHPYTKKGGAPATTTATAEATATAKGKRDSSLKKRTMENRTSLRSVKQVGEEWSVGFW